MLKVGDIQFRCERSLDFYTKPQKFLNHEDNLKSIKDFKILNVSKEFPVFSYFSNLHLELAPQSISDPKTLKTINVLNAVLKCLFPFYHVRSFSNLQFFDTEKMIENIKISKSSIVLEDDLRKIEIKVSGKTYKTSFYAKDVERLKYYLDRRFRLNGESKTSHFPSNKDLGSDEWWEIPKDDVKFRAKRNSVLKNPYSVKISLKDTLKRNKDLCDKYEKAPQGFHEWCECVEFTSSDRYNLDTTTLQFKYDFFKNKIFVYLVLTTRRVRVLEKKLYENDLFSFVSRSFDARTLALICNFMEKHINGKLYVTAKEVATDFFEKDHKFNSPAGDKSRFGRAFERLKGFSPFEDGSKFTFVKAFGKTKYFLNYFMRNTEISYDFLKHIGREDAFLKLEIENISRDSTRSNELYIRERVAESAVIWSTKKGVRVTLDIRKEIDRICADYHPQKVILEIQNLVKRSKASQRRK